MSYSELLKKAIEKSGYSNKEISLRCKELGKSVDPSYISKLVNGKIDPPSDEITQMFSEVLGVESEKLIIEAYLDKAPDSIVSFIKQVRLLIKAPSDELPNHNDKVLEAIEQNINSKPLSDFILEFGPSNAGCLEEIISNKSSSALPNSKFTSGITIEDDSMQPLIPKDSEVIFYANNSYSDGDILGVYDIDNEKILIRKYYNLPNYIDESETIENDDFDRGFFILVPINKNYKSTICHSFLVNDDLITGIKNNKLEFDNKILNSIKSNCINSTNSNGISIIGKVEKVIVKV